MRSLETVKRRLGAHRPRLLDPAGGWQAAVAVVFREREPGALDLLLIERAERADDPWSGHMAFPGGRIDPIDPSLRAAAERETHEEVGLDLATADPLGRLDDLTGRRPDRALPLVISAFVYAATRPGPLRPNYEVREALWVPVETLLHPRQHIEYVYPRSGGRYPGIVVGDPERHVVWGLTYRLLTQLFEVLGRDFPESVEPPDLTRAPG